MPSEQVTGEFTPQKRLHRVSWVFVSVEYLKHFLFPLVAAIFFGAQNDYALWGVFLVVPLIIGAVWQQWVYRYDFGPHGLVIREGLVFRNVRNIDYARIENVDTERSVLHRLLKVAEVRVETSSGGSSEAVVRVLDMPAVQEMRQRIFEARDADVSVDETATEADRELLHLRAAELVRYGLIDNRGMIVIAAVIGLVVQGGMQETMEALLDPWFDALRIENFAALGPLVQTFLVVSTVAGLVAGTRVLSIALALVTLHDFRLTKNGDDFRVQHGLLTRLSLTLRRTRIQAVHQKASLLHRVFRRVSLRVDLAGGLAGGNAQQNNQASARKLWLAPLCTPDKADELIRSALPDVSLHALDWQRLSPRARWRLFRLTCWLWLLFAGVPTLWFIGAWALAIVLPVIPLLWLHAHLYVKHTGWALQENFFVLRRGWVTRRLSIAPRNRIQSVHIAESLFDRRYHMASLSVDTAGASARAIRIPYLDRDSATVLFRALHESRAPVFPS